MSSQGTLDIFTADQVSMDAAAITGCINRIIRSSGHRPPKLGFSQPTVSYTEQAAVPLTTLLGEQIRVQLQTDRYCTECGAESDRQVCRECGGEPPYVPCVTNPASNCRVADCPFPEYKQKSCAHEFVVYLATAGGVKVGITKRSRIMRRWQEQGATYALPIAVAPNRKAAGIIEDEVSSVEYISQRVGRGWYEPMATPIEALSKAVTDAREMFPPELEACFRWDNGVGRDAVQADFVEVPALVTDDLNHRRLNQHVGELEPGHARESRVVGVRGALIATEDFLINTKRYAGHGITIETDAPLIESHDAELSRSGSTKTASNSSADNGSDDTEQYAAADYF